MRFDVRSRSPTLVKASTAYIRGYLRSFGAHIRVEHRVSADRKEMPNSPSATDLTNAAWELIAAVLPAALPGSRPCTTDIRAVLTAIFYLLRTGCQWRLLPRDFPVWCTVHHYFRNWKTSGVWTCLRKAIYERVRNRAIGLCARRLSSWIVSRYDN